MKNRRILIVTGIYPPDIGGPASYTAAIAQRFSSDVPVTVVTYSSAWNVPDDSRLSFRVIRIWRKWPWFFRHAFYGLNVFFQASKHDTLYALSMLNGGIVSLVSGWVWHKKVFVRVPGDYAWQIAVEKGKTGLLIDDFQKARHSGWIGFLAFLEKAICRRADGVIVPSQYLAALVRGWGVPQERIHVIYNGVTLRPAGVSKEEARRQIGISGNIVLSAGRLVSWKGFRMLIKIMPQLLALNQFCRLVIVGEGPDFKALQAMVRNLNMDRKVYLVGAKTPSELAVYLAASDMFVLNTGYEGFSHQILEAMICGVPVVSTAVGGNRELIRQGENGFLVKYNDEFNLIEAVKSIWQVDELRERFIHEGKITAERFDVQTMCVQTMDILTHA